jgi:hypothetical protein
MRIRRAAIPILGAFVLLAGCAPIEEGTFTPPDPAALVAEGKARLAEGDSAAAGKLFRDALYIDSGWDEARYGLVLADAVDLVQLVEDFADLIAEQVQTGTGGKGGFAPLSDDGIGDTIDTYVRSIFLPVADEMLAESAALYTNPDATFTIDALPISWNGATAIDLGGEWDHADAVLLLAGANLLTGLFDALLARDLNFDLGHVFALPIDWTDLGSVDLAAIWRDLVHMVNLLLTDANFPGFLGLTAEGPERMPRAGIELGLVAKYVVETGWLVRQETDDQSDDVIGYVDADGNGAWNEGEPLTIPGVGPLTADQMKTLASAMFVATALQDSLLDGSAIDPLPAQATPFDLAVANPLLMDLTGWGFGPLPHVALDLGAPFARPNADPSAAKAAVVAFLTCVDENEALIDMLRCWIALYGGGDSI